MEIEMQKDRPEGEENLESLHILIVEDDQEIRELVAIQLRRVGYVTTEVANVSDALHAVETVKPDIICLDWMLPGLSGVEFLHMLRVRNNDVHTPVLMLTAKAEAEDIVQGLEAGADDYLTKPFDPKVLQARIKALMRRVNRFNDVQPGETDVHTIGPLSVNTRTYEVHNQGELLHLTPSEFKLLSTMVVNAGSVLTRDRLIQEVQGDGISVIGRTVDTHVFGLRKKLGTSGDLIETIRGVGYRIKVLEANP